jgi:hypothetical protein
VAQEVEGLGALVLRERVQGGERARRRHPQLQREHQRLGGWPVALERAERAGRGHRLAVVLAQQVHLERDHVAGGLGRRGRTPDNEQRDPALAHRDNG